jgi:hypothetical protein
MQTKGVLKKLWKKHIAPLESRNHGGAFLFKPPNPDGSLGDGFVYMDELKHLPMLQRRGDTIFILQPGLSYISGSVVSTRDSGHWTCCTLKSNHLIYFDPLFIDNGVPAEIQEYLNKFQGHVIIDKSSPQSGFSPSTKAFESCGLYNIKFLKNQYS